MALIGRSICLGKPSTAASCSPKRPQLRYSQALSRILIIYDALCVDLDADCRCCLSNTHGIGQRHCCEGARGPAFRHQEEGAGSSAVYNGQSV